MIAMILRTSKSVYAALLILFLVLPSLVVIPMAFSTSQFLQFPPPGYSFGYFEQFFSDPQWTSALERSLIVAVCASLISVPVGLSASWWLIRSSAKFKRLAESFLLLPMMVPVVVFGFGFYIMLLKLNLVGSLTAVVLAHAVLALPMVILTLSASLRTFDFRLVSAARICGAGGLRSTWSVVLPVIFPGIGAATLISLMTSLDEVVIATFVVGDTGPTLPVAMFNSITYDLNPIVPVAATVLTTLTLLLLAVAGGLTALTRRRSSTSAVATEEVDQ